MEECPVCGEEIPLSATECPSCGYEAEQFFLAEQVMTSRVSKRTFDVPPGASKPATARIVTEPARKKRGLHLRPRTNGNGNGNGNGKGGNGRNGHDSAAFVPGTLQWK